MSVAIEPNNSKRGYYYADEWYAVLAETAKIEPVVEVYHIYNRVFHHLLDVATLPTSVGFGGTFAKTDHLLKELGASVALQHDINSTRRRLREHNSIGAETLERYKTFDLRSICLLVEMVTGAPVPSKLAERYASAMPQDERHAEVAAEYLRMSVSRWDEEAVYGQTTEGEEVAVSLGRKGGEGNWMYIKKMLREGTQLNIVRPRKMTGGGKDMLQAELIIYEPDYLVNITSIAHCFTNYDESALVDLMKKIEPSTTTEATLLGNFAGQLLDETIHKSGRSYNESAKDFFASNAVGVLTTEISDDFHTNAKRQRENIRRAMDKALPQTVRSFNADDCMVEPSFVSEMLGLQGRMDLLQLDYKLLLEQKSGKGSFPFDNFVHPRQTDEHYVQLLLYMTIIRYNHREMYRRNGNELHAFLLYSKYDESLLSLGFAPELVLRAFKVRNQIAAAERSYTQPDGFRLLERLTPEMLNSKNTQDRLWRDYQKPQLTELLAPIHKASELERAYYFRMMTFIANEHALAKVGSGSQEDSGFASIWNNSLEEKLESGNIYDRLRLAYPDATTTGSISRIELTLPADAEVATSNFRVGDIVILYPYPADKEPDARRTMVFRCTMAAIRPDGIELTLRFPQSDKRVFLKDSDKPWAIEHDFMEASFGSLYKAMHSFLSAPKSRRDLILAQRKPETDMAATLKGNYGALNEMMSRMKQATELFLLIGPPGTGKTSCGLLNIVKEELLEEGSNMLLTAYTNRAVDEICGKLMEAGIDFVRIGHSNDKEIERRNMATQIAQSENLSELKRRFADTHIIVGTTTAINANIALLRSKPLSLAIVDEASQILEPHLIGLLSAHNDGKPLIKKVVLIGDHKQLPAVVQQSEETSAVAEEQLRAIGLSDCRNSLFQRLLNRYSDDDSVRYQLRKQYRMHHDIAAFPNHYFYNDTLTEGTEKQQLPLLQTTGYKVAAEDILLATRLGFIDVVSEENTQSPKVNKEEAKVIASMAVATARREGDNFDASKTLGIIVPYRNQITAVRNAIAQYEIPQLEEVTIDTVERFQGSQRKYIIYGFTVRHESQLAFLTSNSFTDSDGTTVDRKLNVAMTRAMEGMVMVGNAALLRTYETFKNLLDFVAENGRIVKA